MSTALTLDVIWAMEERRVQASRCDARASNRTELVQRPVAVEMAFYRKYTVGLLRRYMRMSMEMGRVPSLLGKELFRGRVTSYKVKSFEDVVILVHDVEKCLVRLDKTSQDLIARISLQEYTQGEAAAMMGMSLRSVARKYAEALDRLTVIFLELKLLEPQAECGCQGATHGKESGRC
ncbi:MAG: hypothetical protein ACYC46_07850 [Acidobacteriaceae bacterium]